MFDGSDNRSTRPMRSARLSARSRTGVVRIPRRIEHQVGCPVVLTPASMSRAIPDARAAPAWPLRAGIVPAPLTLQGELRSLIAAFSSPPSFRRASQTSPFLLNRWVAPARDRAQTPRPAARACMEAACVRDILRCEEITSCSTISGIAHEAGRANAPPRPRSSMVEEGLEAGPTRGRWPGCRSGGRVGRSVGRSTDYFRLTCTRAAGSPQYASYRLLRIAVLQHQLCHVYQLFRFDEPHGLGPRSRPGHSSGRVDVGLQQLGTVHQSMPIPTNRAPTSRHVIDVAAVGPGVESTEVEAALVMPTMPPLAAQVLIWSSRTFRKCSRTE